MLSSELVRGVLDSAPDAMIIIDAAGKVLFANHQVSALFGYAREEVVGQGVELFLPERFRDRHVGHRQNYVGAVRVRPMGMGLELFGRRKDGSEFPVEISLSPVTQGAEAMVAAAIRDVTARKQAELALQEARRDAEHANLAKSRFLATASHDLRQPLQTLALLNGALRRMIEDADCAEVLREQEIAVEAMSRLLNALLDISKLESGAIRPQPVDFPIETTLDEVRREYASVAASKGLRFDITRARERVHSDPALVGQVLRNLVSNAIKYTPRGSVEVRCERAPGGLRIAVCDTGIGIAADQLGLIYDEFYQVGVAPNESRDGYGLGLSIVQRISRLLGVAVDVRSAPGKGSEFSFVIALAPSRAEDARAAVPPGESAPTPSDAGKRILLVEDEPGVRNAMRTLLRVEGYRVTPAASADEALRLLETEPPFDLLVTDYHLGDGRTGTEVLQAARELRAGMSAVLVTGDTSPAIQELRADDALRITSKPIQSDELLAMIRSLLRS